jgi:glutamate formiminotransferase
MLLECVPNFSEGRRAEVIDAIAGSVRAVPGAHLLDVHSDPDHNRSVLTITGDPGPVVEAAVASTRVALGLIDLRHHQGVHPRMGAVDVVPFTPLDGLTMADCVSLSRGVARRIAGDLFMPVYLYGRAATPGHDSSLAKLRGQGFEWLREMGRNLPQPDYGPPTLHPTAGVVAVGARPALVAFNAILESNNLEDARKIATRIRASSGGMPEVQALGLPLARRAAVQVSMNLLDFTVTGLAEVVVRVQELAAARKVAVREWELVGLLPEAALSGLRPDMGPGLPTRQDTIEWRLARALEAGAPPHP